jgi:LacI family transcriptional regulator
MSADGQQLAPSRADGHGEARHATLIDVARLAKVAPSTASRALHGNPRISEPTKRRVRAAALDLGYQPNRIARSLRTRSASLVGIVVPDIGITFYSRFVKGAQDVLEAAGLQVLVTSTERQAAREESALGTLIEHRVSGVLLATSASSPPEPPIPTVFFDNLMPGHGVANVALANREGIELLVDHLAGHGHTRIAYIGGPPVLTSGAERVEAFRDAVARLAAGLPDGYVEFGDAVWSPQSAAEATRRLLALPERPTAIVTSGDTLALGAMSACRAAGVDLPGQMALVSFDDPVFGDLLDPPVTALTRCEPELGRLAASLLLGALAPDARPGPSQEVRVPVELIVRRSCGCGA